MRVIKQYKRVLKFCYLDWSRLPLLQTLPKEGSQFCDDSAVWSNLAPTLVAGSLDFLSCSTMKTSLFEPRHDKTNNVAVRPAKTWISLGIRQIWSESLLCTQWVAKDPSFLHADSEDSDQTGWMPRLIWVFAESTVWPQSLCWFCHEAAHLQHFVQKIILCHSEIPTNPIQPLTVCVMYINKTKAISRPLRLKSHLYFK